MQKFDFKKFFINLAVTSGAGFIGAYQSGAGLKNAALVALATVLSNLLGLFQHAPQGPAQP